MCTSKKQTADVWCPAKVSVRADLGVAGAPYYCVVCGFRASEMNAVHSLVVAQVLSLFATTIDKGQVAFVHKWLESSPAIIQHCLCLKLSLHSGFLECRFQPLAQLLSASGLPLQLDANVCISVRNRDSYQRKAQFRSTVLLGPLRGQTLPSTHKAVCLPNTTMTRCACQHGACQLDLCEQLSKHQTHVDISPVVGSCTLTQGVCQCTH